MNKYLEKIAEASDYTAPVAVGAGLGAGAGYGVHRGLVNKAIAEHTASIGALDSAKAAYNERVDLIRQMRANPPDMRSAIAYMNHQANIRSLAEENKALRSNKKPLEEAIDVAYNHLRKVKDRNKVMMGAGLVGGAGLAGLGAYMYNREKQASEQDTYERLLPYGYAGVAAPVGAYGAAKYIGRRIDPIQTEHDAIKAWGNHDLDYAKVEQQRFNKHTVKEYERLGAMREAGASDEDLAQQRAKADRLYERHGEAARQVEHQQQKILANEPKLKTMAEQVSKYKKLRLPAALGAATLAGGAAFGLGKLHGKSIDAEISSAYQ